MDFALASGQSGRTSRAWHLELIDLIFSAFIVGPLTIVYWRGTFNFITQNVMNAETDMTTSEKYYRAGTLFLVGLVVRIVLDLVKHYIVLNLQHLHISIRLVIKCLVLYSESLFGVCMWVGMFNIMYTGPKTYWYSLVSTLIISSFLLMNLRAFHCSGGTPLHLLRDTDNEVFNAKSYFNTKLDEGFGWVMADTVFSYLVIHGLLICSWWAIWELENNYILARMEITVKDIQAWDSIAISAILVMAVLPAHRYIERNISAENTLRVQSNIVAVMGFLSAVNYWRGFWSLLDFFFLPSLPDLENQIISHVLGFFLLFLIGASRSLTTRSYKDPEQPHFHSCSYWHNFIIQRSQEPQRPDDAERRPLLATMP